jgi:hypothetical protein
VHELGLAADEGLIGFALPAHLLEGVGLHRQPDAVKHEPAGLLGDAKVAGQLVAADAVFAVDEQPRSG